MLSGFCSRPLSPPTITVQINVSGYYCLTNSPTPQPTGYSNYTTDDCRCPANDTGGLCPVGYYCPKGTPAPRPCPGGYYCPLAGKRHGSSLNFAKCKLQKRLQFLFLNILFVSIKKNSKC